LIDMGIGVVNDKARPPVTLRDHTQGGDAEIGKGECGSKGKDSPEPLRAKVQDFLADKINLVTCRLVGAPENGLVDALWCPRAGVQGHRRPAPKEATGLVG
jgi:hypothetical protein